MSGRLSDGPLVVVAPPAGPDGGQGTIEELEFAFPGRVRFRGIQVSNSVGCLRTFPAQWGLLRASASLCIRPR